MYYPYCTRCLSHGNMGDKICGSCQMTLAVVKEINTALAKFNGNKRKTATYLNMSANRLYLTMSAIPEIYKFWPNITPEPRDVPFQVLGENTKRITFYQHRLLKKILRRREFADISDEKQKEFIEWFYKQNYELKLCDAIEKLLEYTGKKAIKL